MHIVMPETHKVSWLGCNGAQIDLLSLPSSRNRVCVGGGRGVANSVNAESYLLLNHIQHRKTVYCKLSPVLVLCREKPDKRKVGVGIESLLLRGCTVRNTAHTVGFVVYAGVCVCVCVC